jgi:hypothetical protein
MKIIIALLGLGLCQN